MSDMVRLHPKSLKLIPFNSDTTAKANLLKVSQICGCESSVKVALHDSFFKHVVLAQRASDVAIRMRRQMPQAVKKVLTSG